MKPWLFVGAKVVCVSDDFLAPNTGEMYPRVGAVYTVRTVGASLVRFPGEAVITLDEVRNTFRYPDGFEACFRASRFRPVSTINTDATVAALKQAMRDHVAGAGGGMGIRKVRA